MQYYQTKDGLKKGTKEEIQKEQSDNVTGTLDSIKEKVLKEKEERDKPKRDRTKEAESYSQMKEEKRKAAMEKIEEISKKNREIAAREKLLKENPELREFFEKEEKDDFKESIIRESRVPGYIDADVFLKSGFNEDSLRQKIKNEGVEGIKEENGKVLIPKNEAKKILR
jgi:hypothetical protein